MSSMIFRRRDFDPDTGDEIVYENIPAGADFCKTGQRRLYFTSKGLEFRQPVNDTNNGGVPTDGVPSAPIRIVDMGLNNIASGLRSVVVGGGDDGSGNPPASPGGPGSNKAGGNISSVLAGAGNTAAGLASSIIGGLDNEIEDDGRESVILGGRDNIIKTRRSVVLGGQEIIANVENAAFAQRLHTTEYLRLAVYDTIGDIPSDAELEGAVVYVSGVGLHVWDGSVWQPV